MQPDYEGPRARAKAARPTHIQVEESEQSTVLSWRFLAPAPRIILAVICLGWNGMLAPAIPHVLSPEVPLPAKLFAVLLLGGGVVMAYMTLVGFVNTVRLEASRDALTVRHGPLPWPGNRTLPGRELAQLYGKEVKDSEGHVSYRLFAIDKQGREVKLLSHLQEKDHALYLEQALERPLGIEDDPVEGEVAQRTGVA